MSCEHQEFRAKVAVNRIEDIGRFVADVRIACVQCGLEFSFVGLQAGLSYDRPMVSIDGCELRAPIEPGPKPIGHFGSMRFEMPSQKES